MFLIHKNIATCHFSSCHFTTSLIVLFYRDKAEIFQKLNDIVTEKGKKQRWVDDKETLQCTNCREKFTFTFRKVNL